MTLWNDLKRKILYPRFEIRDSRGNIVWYLVAGVAGIGVFYLIFFIFWTKIKGWFINGS